MENTPITLESTLENLSFEIYNPQTDKSENKMLSDYQ